MSDVRIFSILNTLSSLITTLVSKQRGITTDGNKNWVYKDGDSNLHIVANQKKYVDAAWVYESNDFGPMTLHDIPVVETSTNLLCSNSGAVSSITLEDALVDYATSTHSHNSIAEDTSILTVLSSDIVELPGGGDIKKGFKASLTGIDFYKKVGEEWSKYASFDI
jgi:hypothetical protein